MDDEYEKMLADYVYEHVTAAYVYGASKMSPLVLVEILTDEKYAPPDQEVQAPCAISQTKS